MVKLVNYETGVEYTLGIPYDTAAVQRLLAMPGPICLVPAEYTWQCLAGTGMVWR